MEESGTEEQGGNSIVFFDLKNGPNIDLKTGPKCHLCIYIYELLK